jgi:uncharacterized protein
MRIRLAFATTLLLLAGSALAEPSIDQVYQAANAGKFEQARSMMQEVLKAHPDSAKAHYVQAELLARQGDTGAARVELQKARDLNTSLSFARPESVRALERSLGIASANTGTAFGIAPASANVPAERPGVPGWVWMAGLGALVAFLFWRRQRPAPTPQWDGRIGPAGAPSSAAPYTPNAPYGGAPYGSAYPPPPSTGSSLLGSLATGAAIGGGLVAGEALAHRLLDGEEPRHIGGAPLVDDTPSRDTSMGGDDFGISDNSSWDDNDSSW